MSVVLLLQFFLRESAGSAQAVKRAEDDAKSQVSESGALSFRHHNLRPQAVGIPVKFCGFFSAQGLLQKSGSRGYRLMLPRLAGFAAFALPLNSVGVVIAVMTYPSCVTA